MTTAEFFSVKTVSDALNILFAAWTPEVRLTRTATSTAAGRVLARAPQSPVDLPEFVRSSMDGYAVRAADTFGASAALPAYLNVVGVVRMGEAPQFSIAPGQAAEIFTGAHLPPGADAVVMVERTQKVPHTTTGEIEVLAPVAPGENVVQVGEDVARHRDILPAGHRLRAQDIGGLLAVGITEIETAARPLVGIIGSGDELIAPDETPQPGQIRDINSYTLAALTHTLGALVTVGGIARDTFDSLYTLARHTLDACDILVISAGSSVSTRDLTREVINQLGSPGVMQHGLAVKPGKPTLLGVCDGKPVIGLPGNPVSAMLVARQLLPPIIQRFMGETPRRTPTIRAILAANVPSAAGREDTVPVRLEQIDGQLCAYPIFGKSNLIFTLINADGLILVPLNSGGLKADTEVEVMVF